jgi:hypothetical protein
MPFASRFVTLTGMDTRFRDSAVGLYSFLADDVAVACPRCAARAAVTTRRVEAHAVMAWPRRLVCVTCTHAARPPAPTCWDTGTDPFFGLRLWLQTDVRGHVLWAYNEAHLTFLQQYVVATLRERPYAFSGMTLIAKLPTWLKSAKLRPDILRAITRLQT